MNRESTAAEHVPFSEAEPMFEGFSRDDIVQLAYCAGDFVLAIDADHIVRDVAVNVRDIGFAQQWIGLRWVDTVTPESREKVEQMLAGQGHGWRQVNHGDGEDAVAVRYRLIRPANSDWSFAVGRDLRPLAALQQRLLKAQQSMERDYLKLRQTESRYRLLFDTIRYPVLIIDGAGLVVQQANRASHQLLGQVTGPLDGRPMTALFAPACHQAVVAHLGALAVNPRSAPLSVTLVGGAGEAQLSAAPLRQAGELFWLISLDAVSDHGADASTDPYILDIVDKMPDAFVLTDDLHQILVANRSFVDLVQAGSAQQLIGQSLVGIIGRADIDLTLIRKQLREHRQVRNFLSILVDRNGSEEPIELSAVMVDRAAPVFGYALRSIARREREIAAQGSEFTQSVEQLTELVGRKSLKQIVRESTDLIERMCIEAALVHTADNRASAAEILGVSRQSLYSKMHRHGLGNLSDRD